jgi:hypothetical protein
MGPLALVGGPWDPMPGDKRPDGAPDWPLRIAPQGAMSAPDTGDPYFQIEVDLDHKPDGERHRTL